MKYTKRYLILGAVLACPLAQAVPATSAVGFGPVVGGGTISSEATTVQHSSGFRAYFNRRFGLRDGLSIGPHVEAIDGFFETRAVHAQDTAISNYENRILAAGLHIAQEINIGTALAPVLYLQGVGGMGVSKLSVDTSTNDEFTANLYSGLRGTYAAVETGIKVPLQPKFDLMLGVQRSIYIVDQSTSQGTKAIQKPPMLTESAPDPIETRVVQKGLSGTFGLALSF